MADAYRAIVAEIDKCLDQVRTESVEQAFSQVSGAQRLFLVGAGRSALGIRGFTKRLVHLGKKAFLVGETTTPPIGRGDCLIIGSGSGATASLLAIAERAKKIGAGIVLFTIDHNSPIAQLADCVVVIPASTPKAQTHITNFKSIQPMSTLFEECLFLLLDAFVLIFMQKDNITGSEMYTRHANLE